MPYSETRTFAIVCTFAGPDYAVPQQALPLLWNPVFFELHQCAGKQRVVAEKKKKKSKEKQHSLLKAVLKHFEIIIRLHALFKPVDTQ